MGLERVRGVSWGYWAVEWVFGAVFVVAEMGAWVGGDGDGD